MGLLRTCKLRMAMHAWQHWMDTEARPQLQAAKRAIVAYRRRLKRWALWRMHLYARNRIARKKKSAGVLLRCAWHLDIAGQSISPAHSQSILL